MFSTLGLSCRGIEYRRTVNEEKWRALKYGKKEETWQKVDKGNGKKEKWVQIFC